MVGHLTVALSTSPPLPLLPATVFPPVPPKRRISFRENIVPVMEMPSKVPPSPPFPDLSSSPMPPAPP